MGKQLKKSFKDCEKHLMSLIPICHTACQSKQASHVFCSKKKSCKSTIPKFYKNPNIKRYGFILPEDESMLDKIHDKKEDWPVNSQDLTLSESSLIWVPKPKQRHCQICKAGYEDYKEHLSSLKHKEKHESSFFNKDILELCQIFGNIQEASVQNSLVQKSPLKQPESLFLFSEESSIGPVKTERSRPSQVIRSQRSQPMNQPINFESNYKISQTIPQNITLQSSPDKNVIDPVEYDKQVTREFEKDFMEFQIQMDMIQNHGQKGKTNRQKTWQTPAANKFYIEPLQTNTNENFIRYPVTEHKIFLDQKQKTPMRAASFRNSAVSNREKLSIKRPKDKMFPKEIESEKGSGSSNSSSRESVFLGRGLDGLTEKRASFQENENLTLKKDRFNLETMITQESHIKNSQINMTTEESHSLTSPKSQYNIRMAFGGGSKYGAAGMSYQEIGEMKGRKIASSTKFHL